MVETAISYYRANGCPIYIPGFLHIDLNPLSHLVSLPLRTLPADAKNDVLKVGGSHLLYLCLLLRLAVLLTHSRSDQMLPAIELTVVNDQQWQLSVSGDAKQWPLLVADLHDEQVQFKHWDIELNIQSDNFVD